MNNMRGTVVTSKIRIGSASVGTLFKIRMWGIGFNNNNQKVFMYDAVSLKVRGSTHVGYYKEFLTEKELQEDFQITFEPLV